MNGNTESFGELDNPSTALWRVVPEHETHARWCVVEGALEVPIVTKANELHGEVVEFARTYRDDGTVTGTCLHGVEITVPVDAEDVAVLSQRPHVGQERARERAGESGLPPMRSGRVFATEAAT